MLYSFKPKESKASWLSPILVAVMVYLFLIVFQPFGTYNYQHSLKYILLLPYSIIAFSVFFISSILKNKKIKECSWKAQILNSVWLLLICSLLNYFYSLFFINHSSFSFNTLAYMMIFTLSLGIPICTIDLLLRHSLHHSLPVEKKKNLKYIETRTPQETLLIYAENNQKLYINHNHFIYAKSEGNYTSIFHLHENTLQKTLIRISLKELEKQICSSSILRCHRSYIINTEKVFDKKGNANGYQLQLEYIDGPIPVSRSYLHLIKMF